MISITCLKERACGMKTTFFFSSDFFVGIIFSLEDHVNVHVFLSFKLWKILNIYHNAENNTMKANVPIIQLQKLSTFC